MQEIRPDLAHANNVDALSTRPEGTSLSLERLATVTVTYFPDLETLGQQLDKLPTESLKIIADNTTEAERAERLPVFLSNWDRTKLLQFGENIGLAAAINRGVAAAQNSGCEWVLLLDQDSEPMPDSLATLMGTWLGLRKAGEPVGAVGPLLHDPESGIDHGFHVVRCGLWLRRHPPASAPPLRVNSLNGSGTLLAISDFAALEGLDESLFIDHVDTEWSFRMLAAGYCLYGIPAATFAHRMGERCRRIWLFGWRAWPERTPQRHYFLFRNAVRLMRYPHVPLVWKAWVIVKLGGTALIEGLTASQKRAQLREMLRGVREGMAQKPE